MFDNQTVCHQCSHPVTARDWTCPRCGEVIDKYLFGTVTLKSLEDEGRTAYQAGYRDCLKQAEQTGSWTIRPESYRPSPGNETAYRAGWQAAVNKLEAKADRKFGRRRGLRVFGSGVVLFLLGIGFYFGTGGASGGHVRVIVVSPIAVGALNMVIGVVMMLTGENDEARPA